MEHPNIFISHSSKDEAVVRWLAAQVKAAGHQAWVAEWDLQPGEPLSGKVWYRHNGMVEALSALRDHERMSFSEHGSPTGAVDWFRAFREIELRLMDLAARTQCSVQEHRVDAVRSWRPNEHDWSGQLGLVPGNDRPVAVPPESQTPSTP